MTREHRIEVAARMMAGSKGEKPVGIDPVFKAPTRQDEEFKKI